MTPTLPRFGVSGHAGAVQIKSEVARDYGITRFWVQTLVKRFQVEGEAAFEPKSRRPHSNPRAVGLELEDQIVSVSSSLCKRGSE